MHKVNIEKCFGCGLCINNCPQGAISIIGDKASIDSVKCSDCGRCVQVCPQGAIYSGERSQQNFYSNYGQKVLSSGFGMGGGQGRGMGGSMGRGLGRGPRDGRGQGRGGGRRR
ncbi:MAG: 4Fe-4S binding protein [Candidatus Omnitrophica bacterium]|nr:4Fe-4S binding protein [Candidatus Omnitrophota bacterium]